MSKEEKAFVFKSPDVDLPLAPLLAMANSLTFFSFTTAGAFPF